VTVKALSDPHFEEQLIGVHLELHKEVLAEVLALSAEVLAEVLALSAGVHLEDYVQENRLAGV